MARLITKVILVLWGFQKKKFEIRSVGSPAGRKFTYYTESDVKSKYLLTLSKNTHIFQMAIQPKLMEIRHLEEEGERYVEELKTKGLSLIVIRCQRKSSLLS